jgi:eukaryotic-like serine/threonine-protein kinase
MNKRDLREGSDTMKQIILKGTAGNLSGRKFVLQGPAQWVLGRSEDCSLRLLGDITVSRQHAVLDIDSPSVSVRDLGSLNGTYVNGENIGMRPRRHGDAGTMYLPPPCALGSGDELRIGCHAFRVELVEAEDAVVDDTVGERERRRWAMSS